MAIGLVLRRAQQPREDDEPELHDWGTQSFDSERVDSVLDGAVLVISAVEGVQPQTRILMRTLRRLKVPVLIFVNKIDRGGARYGEVLAAIAERLTPAVI